MTGLASNRISSLDVTGTVYKAKEENKRVAEIIGINSAARLTCVKPSGTASMIVGASSGIHAWHSPYYIRRIRVNKIEPIYSYLSNHHPELMEEDDFNPDGGIISIPQKSPVGALTSKEEDSFMFLERVRNSTIHWVNPGHTDGQNSHNVSATVYIKENEWDEIGEWMWRNRYFYNGLSCFPEMIKYPQAPFESCTKEKYEKMMVSLKSVDLSKIIEEDDNTDFANELACAGGACEI